MKCNLFVVGSWRGGRVTKGWKKISLHFWMIQTMLKNKKKVWKLPDFFLNPLLSQQFSEDDTSLIMTVAGCVREERRGDQGTGVWTRWPSWQLSQRLWAQVRRWDLTSLRETCLLLTRSLPHITWPSWWREGVILQNIYWLCLFWCLDGLHFRY